MDPRAYPHAGDGVTFATADPLDTSIAVDATHPALIYDTLATEWPCRMPSTSASSPPPSPPPVSAWAWPQDSPPTATATTPPADTATEEST